MVLLILGLVLWSAIHLLPVVAPDLRAALINRFGEWPYKGVFSLGIFSSLALIVFGWRSIEEVTILFNIYDYAVFPALLMILAGFVLMAASKIKSNFKRTFRHPQQVGFTLWALAHFLVNGELRSSILFGGMLLWSLLTILLTNKRDGAFVAPKRELPHKGVIVFVIGMCVFIAAVLGHEHFTGVNLQVRH